jgi:HK97 family phage major capsid protein
MSPSDHPGWGGRRDGAGRPAREPESERYSLSRAIADALTGSLEGLEAECDQEELRRRASIPGLSYLSGARSAGGLSLALPMVGERVVSVGGDGGSLVGETKSIVSDLLSFSAVRDAGATVLENLQENISLAWTSKLPEPTWQPELGFSVETDPEFDAIIMRPFRVCGSIIVSRQLLVQGAANPSMDRFLLNELSRSCSSQLDRTALYGNPATNPNQPAGVKFTAGIHEIEIGPTDLEWELLVEAERLSERQNVAFDSFGYITSPDVKAFLRRRLREVGADTYIWEALPGPFQPTRSLRTKFFSVSGIN